MVVTGDDPVDRGIAAARIVVALWGEWIDARLTDRTPTSVTIVVAPRA